MFSEPTLFSSLEYALLRIGESVVCGIALQFSRPKETSRLAPCKGDPKMADEHPNIALLQSLDLRDVGSAKNAFSEDFVWHFFNPQLPDIQGDYVGVDGLGSFFETMHRRTGGSFKVEPISITAAGDELVVTHVKDCMTVDGQDLEVDAVAVWRFVDGRIAEAWDIPAVHGARVVGRDAGIGASVGDGET